MRMRIIFYQFKILILEVKDALDLRIYLHLRQFARLAGELKSHLLKVIGIYVCGGGWSAPSYGGCGGTTYMSGC